ncbi:SRPBCC family protein [Nostoc sp. CHAB 5784]|uniref:SRPBCC family protein n=1 Tax=Nostoc mirabile TaxID=2907820 RepID=UPI001E54859D|nr:SRPBCC family protein [Nostoc mirabile]MCC5670507.1 SRPBCC family protein [Nostoc mirabile CHAB5784]
MPFSFSFSSEQFANLIAGKRLSLTADKFTPLSPDKFWSAFDDYLTLQQALSGHPDVILETGDNQPANGVGATIRFEYANSITRETLIIYEPQKRIWKIKLPEANSIFSFYEPIPLI